MKKRNKLFAVIGACFMLALSCISFIVPKNKNIESAGAYVMNGGSVNNYNPNGLMPIYTGVNNVTPTLDNTQLYYDTNYRTLTSGTHTIKYVYNSVNQQPSSLLYDIRTFGGLPIIQDETTAQDLYKSYLNYIGYVTDDFTTSGVEQPSNVLAGGLEIMFYINITGINTDFYITHGSASVQFKLNGETYTPSFAYGGSSVGDGASILIYARDVDLFDNISFYEALNNLQITYTFSTSLASTDVTIFAGWYYGEASNYVYNSLYSNEAYNMTMAYDTGSVSLIDYFTGAYSSGSGYYNSYWNDYYNNLYNSQLQSVTDSAYNNGYSAGFISGSDSKSILPDAIMTFASLPFSILSGLFSFDLFGFNTYTLFLSIITIFVCIYLISKIKG